MKYSIKYHNKLLQICIQITTVTEYSVVHIYFMVVLRDWNPLVKVSAVNSPFFLFLLEH